MGSPHLGPVRPCPELKAAPGDVLTYVHSLRALGLEWAGGQAELRVWCGDS